MLIPTVLSRAITFSTSMLHWMTLAGQEVPPPAPAAGRIAPVLSAAQVGHQHLGCNCTAPPRPYLSSRYACRPGKDMPRSAAAGKEDVSTFRQAQSAELATVAWPQ